MTAYEKLQGCLAALREKTDFVPQIALVLGSGLGDYAEEIEIETTVSYHDLPGFPISTVHGHAGRFVFGRVKGVPVVAMQGRVHFYEGYDVSDVVLPIRLMGLMGAKILFLTNAAGGANFTFQSGDFMLITDQISSFVPSALAGPNIEELGLRFPDMSEIYARPLRAAMLRAATDAGIHLKQGVYLQASGPAFESPAEVRMFRALGADAVGMSTAVEAVAARHMGLSVCGISFISNLACGMSAQPLSHEEVNETAERVGHEFKRLVTACIPALAAV